MFREGTMNLAGRRGCLAIFGSLFLAYSPMALADGPTTSVSTEYLMTVTVPLEAPLQADANFLIFNSPGGTVSGRINGKLVPPAADWFKVMPTGVNRLDVRGVIRTADEQIIYFSYNGVSRCEKDVQDRLLKGEQLGADDCYFLIAPTFETKSEKYAWINAMQTVGKMTEVKLGENSHVKYDIFAVR
jgi:Protein of unknown function (DUF3237)